MTTFLADTFCALANDPSWPWKTFYATGVLTASHNDGTQMQVDLHNVKELIISAPLTMARLALVVVERSVGHSSIPHVLHKEGINPDHYANVKERVKEAK